jgi:hypothetical protein
VFTAANRRIHCARSSRHQRLIVLESLFVLRRVAVGASLVMLSFVGSCSSQQAYGVGQAWQRNECYKITDAQERGRCLASSSTSYEEYQRQSEAVKKPPQ